MPLTSLRRKLLLVSQSCCSGVPDLQRAGNHRWQLARRACVRLRVSRRRWSQVTTETLALRPGYWRVNTQSLEL